MAGQVYASGNWHVHPGQAEEFVAQWRRLLTWTRDEHEGLDRAVLIASESDPQRFLSFAQWRSAEERDAWKGSDGFRQRMASCRALCDDFVGGDFAEVVRI